MPVVGMPDGTQVDFGDMPPEQIKSMIAQKFPDAEKQATAPKGFLESAMIPINTYPATQHEMAKSGLARMDQGVDQIRSGVNLALDKEARSKLTPAEEAAAGPLSMAKGAGNLALGGMEYVSSPITAAYRTVIGNPVEQVTGIPKEITEFGAMLATPGLGLTRLPRSMPKVTPPAAALTPGEEVAAAGQRLGVDLPRAVTTDSPTLQQVGKVTTNIPLAGGPLRSASEAAITDLGVAAQDTRAAYGSGSQAAAGAGVREGITENLKSGPIKTRVGELYDRVDNLVDPVVTGAMPNTRNLVNTISGRRVNAALPESSATKDLETALARPGGMNYEGIKDLRTHYGEMMDGSTPVPQGMSEGEVKKIYGALSSDMRIIIAKAGGQDGLRAYQQAENAAKRWSGIRDDLGKILNTQSEEAIFSKIEAMAGSTARADINLLGRVRGAVGPQHWDEMASAVIGKMGWPPGGTGFSPDAFLTAYKKMSDEGKRILFRSTDNASHAQAIDDIAKVSERFKQLNKYANPSGTGQTVAGGAELFAAAKAVPAAFAGGFVEPISLVGGIVGGRILSHVLARPMTARAMATWSKDYAAVAANSTPAKVDALEASTKVFAASIGKDFGRADLVPDLIKKLQGALPTAAEPDQPASFDERFPK